jgi:acyl-CoA thioesterase FadM
MVQQHVNNVNYYRYAESARVNWITNFAVHVDPGHRRQWRELMTPRSTGLIMRSLKADFKFVCFHVIVDVE